MPSRCQTSKDVDSGAKVCDTGVRWTGMYCKGCREQMMANGTWTEARAKHQNEFNAIVNEKDRARQASLSVEKKEARRTRDRIYNRVVRARNRDAINAAKRQRRANIKLDPVKWEALRQRRTVANRKHYLKLKAEGERKRARTSADDDDDDDDESAEVQGAILGDNVIVISDDEDEGAVELADDSSGSDVEGIEFVSSDDEQLLEARG
jgi:hypothetical protein